MVHNIEHNIEEIMMQGMGHLISIDEKNGLDVFWAVLDRPMFSAKCPTEERSLATGISIYEFEKLEILGTHGNLLSGR